MFQLVGNIPVWGDHDEATLAQIQRCTQDPSAAGAALMADGHKGYSQPIGGVVAYRNAVSPSGVGYDISCLAAGTPVTTGDGFWLPIEQARADHALTCWDGERVRRVTEHQGAIVRPARRVLRIRLANGRAIRATPDHLIRTRSGWRPAGELAAGDAVACAVFVGLPHRPADDASVRLALPAGCAPELVQRGLLPLRAGDPRLPAIVRLLGALCGAGQIGRGGTRVCIGAASLADADSIAADIARLGFRAAVAPHPRRSGALLVSAASAALRGLFAGLGAPLGTDAWSAATLDWLFRLPEWLRAQFLAGLCSASMSSPSVQRGRLAPLTISRLGRGRNHLISALLESLGFAVSTGPGGRRRNRHNDDELQIVGGDAAQMRFLEQIGFCYAQAKRARGAAAACLHWRRAAPALQSAAAAAPDRLSDAEAARSREPAFARSGEIVWVPVAEVAPGAVEPVYDVVTSDPAHAFFASGLVVHNCGNKAARTNIRADDLRPQIGPIMDQIARTVVFGVGQTSGKAADHELFDDPAWRDIREVGKLQQLARQQLGTVGSGNHFVDLFEDEEGWVWVGVHFGSRGLGHRTASGFLNLAAGRAFDDRAPGEHMDQLPTVLRLDCELGQRYWQAMELAGRYAYAGRDFVVGQVLAILGAQATDEVHNHHNYAWRETHGGEELVVVRKGATPAWPGQRGFIGGSMGDISVIVEGVESEEALAALHSTVHGAGRVMSRTQAAGKRRWVKRDGRRVLEQIKPGQISRQMMQDWLRRVGVELRGGGTDESPHVYRRLPDVLAAHQPSIRVLHTLRPLGVAMAGEDVEDPYKD
jgi:tRNA-splicing ligase RtcB